MQDTGGGSGFGVGYMLPGDTNFTIVGPATTPPHAPNGTDSAGNAQNYWTIVSHGGGGNVQVDQGTTLTAGSIVNVQTLTMNGNITLSSGPGGLSDSSTPTTSTPIAVSVNSVSTATTLTLGASNTFTPGALTINDASGADHAHHGRQSASTTSAPAP